MKGSCASLLWRRIVNLFVVFVFLFSQFFVFVPQAHAAPTFSNSGFETNLSGWSPTFDLLDQFNTAVSAGSVNGTTSEPSGAARTVTDTNNKLNIGSGVFNTLTGTSPIVDGLWYPGVSRVAGKTFLGTLTGSGFNYEIGWDTDQLTGGSEILNFADSSTLRYLSSTAITIGIPPTLGTSVNTAMILRSTGTYTFIKESTAFPTWTLLWMTSSGNTATMYPVTRTRSASAAYTADNMRIPTSTWLPTPTAYDTFTTASSTSTETAGPDSQTVASLPWTGSTWTVSGGSVSNTPTTGSELLTNQGLEDWVSATNLSTWSENITGGTTVNQETVDVHGGSNAARVDVDASNSGYGIGYALTVSNGTWLTSTFWAKDNLPSKSCRVDIGAVVGSAKSLTTSYQQFTQIGRAIVANPSITYNRNAGTSSSIYFDDISTKALDLPSLFRTVDSGSADGLVEASVTGPTSTSGVQGGLVLNLDSTTDPQNFIIVYLDGAGSVKVDEAVSGVYTNKQSTAVTYSAGATLRAIKYGNSLDVYYNNAKVGSTLTMTANTNTRMGLFSTSSTNTFDNFAVWPRSGYSVPDFIVSPSTTNTYNGSRGSAKLEAGANSGNFTQALATGDSRNYTLTTYAYTDGSQVTSSDLQIYGNGKAVTTSFSPVGSGWYKVTGTVLGSTSSSTTYGVQVQAGKTVYVDDFSLSIQDLSTGGGGSTSCTTTPPSFAPTITSSTNGDSSITLNFSKAGDPTSYYALEYGTQSGSYPYGSTNIGGSSTTSYAVNSLNPNTTYYFRVRGGNDCATGSWSNEYKAATLGTLTSITTIPTQEQKPLVVPTYEGISPSPAPIPSPTPVSTQETGFKFELPKISIPRISLPRISFNIPKISLPRIAVKPISIKIPELVINLSPISNFVGNSVRQVGQIASGIATFAKESVAYAGFVSSERYKKQTQVWNRIGEWINFTGTSFKEIVLDESPTRISDVKVAKVGSTSAVITWKTNHLSTSKVNYGETLSYGQDVQSDLKVHDHMVEIDNLKPGTKYVFEVMSQNKTYVYDAWHEFETSK